MNGFISCNCTKFLQEEEDEDDMRMSRDGDEEGDEERWRPA